ncbi:GumC family protein [Calothrix rhizosoleniae]|uniref:GumC family protein n=1 Tax=Calothrix rhizosoleniae TaxID=888997 RepID=UPI000B4998A1|nr:polysaccharide biosynthesis tyrosine autokinase [Calothrix rhizosoleniae]
MMDYKEHFEEIDFHKYWLVLQRRWLPATGVFSLVVGFSSFLAFSAKPTYKAESNILVETNKTASLTGLEDSRGKLEPLARENTPLDTQAKIVTSVPVIEETIKSLELKDEEGELLKIRDFLEELKVLPIAGTDIIEISYTDKEPELAAKVVNKLVQVYIKNNIEANRAQAASTRKFIRQQLPSTETAVIRAESALRRFKEKYKVISLKEEASASVLAIAKIEELLTETQANLFDIDARAQKLQQEINIDSEKAVAFASLSQTPGIQNVLEELQQAESKLAVEQTKLQPTHPTVVNLQEQATALRGLLEQRTQQINGNNQPVKPGNLQIRELQQALIGDMVRIQAERLGLEKRMAALTQSRLAYKQRANILPRLEQAHRELERKLEAAQTTYETLLTRLQEINVAENQNIGNARIVSPALVPDEPVPANKKLVIGGGAFAGALLAITLAFLLDLTDRSLKTVKEARELFQYTLLAVIPALGSYGKNKVSAKIEGVSIPKIIGRDLPQFPVGDIYQILQANLKFLSDTPLQSIVVTSSVPREGKSSISANLATAMAQVGRRVLLVDADMRRPTQHHIWQLTNAVGLSNLIVDQLSLDTTVQEVMPNLHVLTSGVIPPNPVSLLDSQRMSALIDTFNTEYDIVIFDTPPLAGTADAGVLGKLADGILMVVRPGVADWNSSNAAKEFLNQSGQNVLGMVVNDVNVKREPEGYFYYNEESAEGSKESQRSVVVK